MSDKYRYCNECSKYFKLTSLVLRENNLFFCPFCISGNIAISDKKSYDRYIKKRGEK